MNSFQQQLKHLREEQQLTIDGAASKMSFTAQTIQMLEDTDDLFSLNLPTQSLKNYYRKYGECLGMPERKIVSILNKIDYLDYKRSRRGKLKLFDYINRLIILVLIAMLGHSVYSLYQQQKIHALKQSVVMLNSPVAISKKNTTKDSTEAKKVTKAVALTQAKPPSPQDVTQPSSTTEAIPSNSMSQTNEQ